LDSELLQKNLDELLFNAQSAFAAAIETHIKKNSKNPYPPEAVLAGFRDESIASFERFFNDALQLASAATNERSKHTTDRANIYAQKMITAILEIVSDRSRAFRVLPNQLSALENDLTQVRASLANDFISNRRGLRFNTSTDGTGWWRTDIRSDVVNVGEDFEVVAGGPFSVSEPDYTGPSAIGKVGNVNPDASIRLPADGENAERHDATRIAVSVCTVTIIDTKRASWGHEK